MLQHLALGFSIFKCTLSYYQSNTVYIKGLHFYYRFLEIIKQNGDFYFYFSTIFVFIFCFCCYDYNQEIKAPDDS